MVIFFECVKCLLDGFKKQNKMITSYISANTLNDDGYFEFICPNNHHNRILLRAPKFEILFMIGENAILDGYFREAVSTFYTSLERAYEEYIKFTYYMNNVSQEAIDESWKCLTKQSERQFGAFVSLWVLKNSISPLLLSNKYVKLRNDVIHHGYIPSKDEAINFGNEVIDIIEPIYNAVVKHDRFYEYLDEKINLQKYEKDGKHPGVYNVMTGIQKKIDSKEKLVDYLNELSVFKQHYELEYDIHKAKLGKSDGYLRITRNENQLHKL
jgi:hypothetical protein